MKHVLVNVSLGRLCIALCATYNNPMPKTASNSFFWRFGMSRVLITPMGRRAVAQSVKILTAALAYLYPVSWWPLHLTDNRLTYQTSNLGKHLGSLKKSSAVQKRCIGTHITSALNVAHKLQRAMMPIIA
jgi:hypothetical protein